MTCTMTLWESAKKFIGIKKEWVKAPLAEFFGTFIFSIFCVAAATQYFIINRTGGTESAIVPVLATVVGLMFAIMLAGGVSGGHINPAVTVGLCVAGLCKWSLAPLYMLAQFLGAYLGALFCFSIYQGRLEAIVGAASNLTDDVTVSEIFAPSGPKGVTVSNAIGTEIYITALLLIMILSCVDQLNMEVPKHMIGLFVALTVLSIAFCFGQVSGALLNPAKDFSCRLAAISLGWDSNYVLRSHDMGEVKEWWVVGLFGPLIGGAVGAILYIAFIGAHLQSKPDDTRRNERTHEMKNLL